MTLTFTYSNSDTPIAGVKVVMTESDGTVTVLVTDANGQITLPSTSNTYTLSASLNETGDDPISLVDAIQILQYAGELRTLTDDQKIAADVNNDGGVDVLDAVWILQHQGELRTINQQLVFLDANTGKDLSETIFTPGDNPTITVIRMGDVDQDFDPSLITDHAPIITGKTTLVMDENETSVSTLIGSDADGDALTYSVTGGADQSLFTIDETTGVLSFKAGPDYEDPTDSGGDNLYDIEVSVSDGTNISAQALVVSIKDLNEKIAMTNKLINENTPGATVGDLSILDTDFGNENITYVLSGTDAQYFVLEGTTIKLKSDVTTDYEIKNSYTLTVTATNPSGTSVVEKVVVKIVNVNETPILNNALSNQSQNEDAVLNFTIPDATFTDEDGDSLSYTTTLSNGSTLPSWLTFNASTLTFSGTPLNADVGAIEIIVTASDGNLNVSDTFTLTVINTNDDPTAIILLSNNVDENINGAVVGDISTSDVDASDKHVYTLSGDDASFFEVINGQLKFKNSVSANYEIQDSYEVSVTSTDLAGSAFSQSFSIKVNDVNDAPTQLTLSASVLDENSEGTVIGTVNSIDEDGDDVSYALSGPYGYYFEIVEDQLKLKENFSANFEANNTLSFTINATDSKGLVTSKNFTITVNDINDAPSNIELSANSLKNNSNGANIGKVLVVDDDNNESFTYAINDDRFEIVNGVLKLKNDQSIDYDTEPTISIEITVTDSQGAEFSQTLTVLVGEVKLDNYQFDENVKGAAIGSISTEGIASSGIVYSLSGEDARFFEITSEGILKLKQDFQADHERDNSYEVTITAKNNAGESLTTSITLAVNDVAEALESAQLIFGKNTVFSYDSIWLKNSNNDWFEFNSYAIHIDVAEKESDQEVYLFSINLIDDQNGSYNLLVKSPSGYDVSENFRLDPDTGAVYLKAGNSLDFETSTGHYHAGTETLSYGIYGPDYAIDDSVRPLIFSLEDEFGKVNLTYTENFSLYNPVYIILDYGDTAADGILEIGHTLPNSELNVTNNALGEIVASAGGKDITGDGFADAVFLINNNNDTLDLYIVPGGERNEGMLENGTSYLIARWDNTLEYIPTDMELGDINGDGFADIVFGFGNEHFENNDHDYNGSRLDTDGMVEIIHGSTLSSLLDDITWTSFLSPLDGRLSNFGTEIAIADINNDGYDDIIAGAPFADKSDVTDIDDGAVFIIYGKAILKINSYNSDAESYESGDYGVSINYLAEFSGNADSRFGEVIAEGDFNGDGIGDFAVSMSEYGIPAGNGVVHIYFGSRFGTVEVKVVINGIQENAQLGGGQGALHNLGDVNGDGYDDLGMKDADGKFFIVWGKQIWSEDYDYNGDGVNDTHLLDLSAPNSLDGTYLSGSLIGSFFTFKGVGDVNNDGFDDFLINTPYKNWTSNYDGVQTGQSLLVYGQSEWLGEFENSDLSTVLIKGDVLGLQVIALGDFDNDGSDEFAFTSGYDYENQNIITWWGNDRPNESQPDPLLVLDNHTVLENSLGAVIGNFTVSNLVSDETVDYTNIILSGNHADLLIITSNGELKLTDGASLNFENFSDLTFSLSGYTSSGNQFYQDFTIKVVDINEAPDFTLKKQWVNNYETGAVLGAININDLELHDTYTYLIEGIDSEYFEISLDGLLKLKENVVPNFENKSDYSISISVSDASGLTVTKSITIAVNLAPTNLELSNITIDESHYGISVGELNVLDPNAGDNISFTLSGPDESFFEINQDGILKLKDDTYANYELKDSFVLTVTAEDQGGLTIEKTFSIYVNNLDYATPYVSDLPSLYTVSQPDDYYVKAMLFGITLDPDNDPSTPLTVTYSIVNPNSIFAPGYRGEYFDNPHLNIQTATNDFINAVDKVFELWGQVTGINFVKVTETDEKVGDIRIGLTEVGEWAGISLVDIYGLNSSFKDSGDSDIWIENGGGNLSGNWQDGTFGFQTLLHEVGHSLGFKHPHSSFTNPSGWYSPPMVSEYDAQYWSVMAYRDYVGDDLKPLLEGFSHQNKLLGCGTCGSLNHTALDGSGQMETKNGDAIYPYTPMFFDIYAALYLYGYNKETDSYNIPDNNSGDDTYTISGPVNFTIFDTGGTDTIDFSILNLNSEINLDSPLSYIGTDEIIYDDGEFYTGYIVSIFFYNAMENVTAGGGIDTITCNIAVNTINCGPGPDTVNAIGAEDSIYGEVGNDTFVISDYTFSLIDGGSGIDRLDLTSLAVDGSNIDLTIFDDSQIKDIEEIYLQNDDISTLIKLTKESILNFNSSRASDQDGDGDVDSLFYILGDSNQDFVSLLSAEGWTYFKTENSYDWYKSSDGDVYFATTSGMGVYEISNNTQITFESISVLENVVNAGVGSVVISNFNQLSQTNSLNYTLGGEDADKFEIDSDGNLKLKTGIIADFETKSTYQISISVLGISKDIEINVTDASENTINGSSSSQNLTGTDIDDIFDSGGGDDVIDGKGGNDTVLIFDYRDNYEITTLAGITKIKAKSSADDPYSSNTISLTNTENVQFSDTAIALDTDLNDATYFYGTSSSQNTTGTDGDDVFDSGGGDDVIDGKGGNDTVLIFDDRDNYEITTLEGVTNIEAKNSAGSPYINKTISLTNVEFIIFADQTVNISDLTSQGSPTGKPTDNSIITDDEEHIDNEELDENTLSEVDLWANEFNTNSIILPSTTTTEETNETIDLNGFLGFETDSLALNFDAFSESSVVADTQPVKTTHSITSHAVIDFYEDSLTYDLVYSSELG